MSNKNFLDKLSFHLINDILRQKRNDPAVIKQQIEQEEQNFKAAVKADEVFSVVKAIREKIKHLQYYLNTKQRE